MNLKWQEKKGVGEKLTVTVGIPAYNEEKNIGKLLQDIFCQNEESYHINSVFVVSDGSADKTVSEASRFETVTVLEDGKRKGKATRINEIFGLSESDIVIVIDADISLEKDAFEEIIKPFILDPQVMLASGRLTPIVPKTFAGKVAFVARYLSDIAVTLVGDSEMYRCEGPFRAFRKEFYEKLSFPSATADDVYPYFVCKQLGYGFSSIDRFLGSYKLPSTFSDFRKQQKRFLESEQVHRNNFGVDFIKRQYTITPQVKIKALFKTFTRYPIETFVYFVLWVPIKFQSLLFRKETNGVWDSVISTK